MSHSVSVAGIAPTVSEEELRNFFSYCGEIVTVLVNAVANTAVVTFSTPDGAETATLLSGAVVGTSPVTVTRSASSGGLAASSIDSAAALAFVEGMVSRGLVTGEALIAQLRAQAATVGIPGGNAVVGVAVEGAKAVVNVGRTVVTTAVGAVTGGSQPLGQPTTGQWMYGNQPQWGAPPAGQCNGGFEPKPM